MKCNASQELERIHEVLTLAYGIHQYVGEVLIMRCWWENRLLSASSYIHDIPQLIVYVNNNKIRILHSAQVITTLRFHSLSSIAMREKKSPIQPEPFQSHFSLPTLPNGSMLLNIVCATQQLQGCSEAVGSSFPLSCFTFGNNPWVIEERGRSEC